MSLVAPELWVPSGLATIGDDHHYPEERPSRTVHVDGFFIDQHPVTNAQFAEFVTATDYVTDAEQHGGNVFVPAAAAVDLSRPSLWWRHEPAASWRRPLGAEVITTEHQDHPVVQVSQRDAAAYSHWVGRRLPTEIEWEWAANDGTQLPATWPIAPDGMLLANVWLGEFPWKHIRRSQPSTMPVGSFAGNSRGLFDMLGNVWEWTSDSWIERHDSTPVASPCCSTTSADSATTKGGSFLCAANYCARYRPAARHAQPRTEPACHTGFRCARSAAGS